MSISSDTKKLDSEKLLRLKYYKDIKRQGNIESKSFLVPPDTYYINPNLFMVIQPSIDNAEAPRKAKSWVTILSVWNSMIGSNIVSIPWSTSKAGLIPAILINLVYFLICYYTAVTICKTGIEDNDFSDTIEKYLGKKYGPIGRYLQVIFSIMLNVGATYIYFLIIKYFFSNNSQNLFPILAFILNKIFSLEIQGDNFEPTFGGFSIIYCAIVLGIALFPIINMKEITFLIKISSKGIFFVSFLLLFVYYTGIKGFFDTTYDYKYILNKGDSPSHILLFGDDPSKLAGALSLGYFTHTIIIPVIKNNEDQKNNKRDLFLGYLLVFITYTTIGITGYYGFSGSSFYDYYKKGKQFSQNWFSFFSPDDIIMLLFRLLSVFQLCSVFPIIVYVTRIQLFGTFWNNNYPSFKHVSIFNLIIIVSALLVIYLFSNSLGSLMGIIGAGTGFFLIYLSPLIINTIYFMVKHPEYNGKGYNSSPSSDDEITLKSLNNNVSIVNQISEPLREKIGVSEKPYSKPRNIAFVIMNILLMIFGLFTLVIQFVNINYFDVHIED